LVNKLINLTTFSPPTASQQEFKEHANQYTLPKLLKQQNGVMAAGHKKMFNMNLHLSACQKILPTTATQRLRLVLFEWAEGFRETGYLKRKTPLVLRQSKSAIGQVLTRR